jgi:transcriptional regulator with XRE-family HTH domain
VDQHLGTRLKALRTERGWTIKEAAQRAGLTPSTLSRLEARRTLGPTQTRVLLRVADLYTVPINALIQDVLE